MRTDKRKESFLKAYVANGCNITEGCKNTNIGRQTYYKWVAQDPDFVKAVEDAQESLIDHVENKVVNLINSNDKEMITWFLRCKAKHRGWDPKSVQDNTGEITVKITKEIITAPTLTKI